MAAPPAAGAIQAAAPTASDTLAPPAQGPAEAPIAAPKKSGKGQGLSLFRRRKSPKGADAKTSKKGRGKRPGVTGGGDGEDSGTPRSGNGTSDGGIDVGGGWIMYTDAEGFQYCWNEALQESR